MTGSDSAWRSSRTATALRRLRAATGESRTRGVASSLAAAARTAAATRASMAAVARVARWSEESSLSGVAATAIEWTRASFWYRWLTAEPEPEVVVIDLRETATVAPLITGLDRVVATLSPGVETSTLSDALGAVAAAASDAPVKAASLVVLAAVLANLAWTAAAGGFTDAGFVARICVAALAGLGTRVTVSWARLRETRPVRLAIAALEPPEPPDRPE